MTVVWLEFLVDSPEVWSCFFEGVFSFPEQMSGVVGDVQDSFSLSRVFFEGRF